MIRGLLVLVATCNVLAIPDKQCGRVQVEKNGLSDRVLGGHEAQKRNWPWLVKVFMSRNETESFSCTGTIVSDRHVLTAAHCFKGIEPKYSKRPKAQSVIVSSRLNGDPDYKKGGWANMDTDLIVHPKYERSFPGFDIAIVELNKTIKFSESDQPICIVDSFRENVGDTAYIVGYGYESVNQTVLWNHTIVDENGKAWNVSTWNVTYNSRNGEAHENLVQFRTIERCSSVKEPLGGLTRHSERTICAVGNKRDTAKGDSGGPLMINQYGVWYQVGTTSTGFLFEDDDGQTKWFSLYTRLSRACDWIDEVTRGYVKCTSMDE